MLNVYALSVKNSRLLFHPAKEVYSLEMFVTDLLSFHKGIRASSTVSTVKLGNLRTTTKFMTTTSVDWENTETKTSVSAGKRKLKMQSVSRSTTTMTKCKQKCKTVIFARNKVFRNGVFYNNARSYFFKPYV